MLREFRESKKGEFRLIVRRVESCQTIREANSEYYDPRLGRPMMQKLSEIETIVGGRVALASKMAARRAGLYHRR